MVSLLKNYAKSFPARKGKTGVDLVSASDRTGERNKDSQDSWSELWNPRERIYQVGDW